MTKRHKTKRVRVEKGAEGRYLYNSRRKSSRAISLCEGSGRVIADSKVNVSAGSAICSKCRHDVGWYNSSGGRVFNKYRIFPHTSSGMRVYGRR